MLLALSTFEDCVVSIHASSASQVYRFTMKKAYIARTYVVAKHEFFMDKYFSYNIFFIVIIVRCDVAKN